MATLKVDANYKGGRGSLHFISLIKRTPSSLCWHSLARGKLSNEIVLMIAITVMTAKNYCPEKGERREGSPESGFQGLAPLPLDLSVYWL